MNLMSGKRYLRRNGTIVTVYKYIPDYPFEDQNGLSYTKSGQYRKDEKHLYDIIAEAPIFEIGKTYKNHFSENVKILHIFTDERPQPIMGLRDNTILYYTHSGNFFSNNTKSKHDLIP